MNQLNWSVLTRGLLRKRVEMFSLRKVSGSPSPNPLALPYHSKLAIVLTSSLQKHFVRYPTSIADKPNSA